MLRHPYILEGPRTEGDSIRIGCLIAAFSRAQKEGRNATSPLHSRGSPKRRGLKKNWLPHPCFLAGPKEGEIATSTLHSWESPNRRG